MNLKLLEKLVRLANNNPNEHEANLAARRACKLIQEANFKFSEDKSIEQQKTVTWNDVKRSTEPTWKSTPQEPNTKYQEDFWTQMYNCIMNLYMKIGLQNIKKSQNVI